MDTNKTLRDAATNLDLVIIGGGPAGMSAALIAGRCLLNAAIINAEAPRNRVTTASHGFLTRDGAHPTELLAVAKEQLNKYPSVEYRNARASAVRSAPDGFVVELASGEKLSSRRVILATGFRDELSTLKLAGIEEVYGKSVYPCPFCDGFEHARGRVALFGGAGVENYAALIHMWTEDMIVFTNGRALDEGARASLRLNGVQIYEEVVRRLVSKNGVLSGVELADGTLVERDSGFLWDDAGVAATRFAEDLGVATKPTEWGTLGFDADDTGKTNVEGVYVVGDARTGFSGLMAAASEGGGCVEHIVHTISHERWLSPEDKAVGQ